MALPTWLPFMVLKLVSVHPNYSNNYFLRVIPPIHTHSIYIYILTFSLAYNNSGILSDLLSGTLSSISSGICSDILSGISAQLWRLGSGPRRRRIRRMEGEGNCRWGTKNSSPTLLVFLPLNEPLVWYWICSFWSPIWRVISDRSGVYGSHI